MMRQWKSLKREHRDSILFFRLGDFYEMFEDDAREVSGILNLTLTKRHGIPMCGIPYHASHGYIGRLLKAGKKIAVCEQISLPKDGKGIAERKVVEIITPGTVVEEDFLERDRNNYLLALGKYRNFLSLAYIDLSTAEFTLAALEGGTSRGDLKRELLRLSPREIIVQESLLEDKNCGAVLSELSDVVVNRYPDWSFDLKSSAELLKKQLKTANLKGFGIEEDDPALFACGILLEYLGDTSQSLLPHVKNVFLHREENYLGLDESSLKNLEILTNLQDGSRRFTLLDTLNATKTSMGSRKLRNWLIHPLLNPDAITARQDRVAYLYHNQIQLNTIRETLRGLMDLERLSSRIALEKAHAKDLVSVRNTLAGVEDLVASLSDWQVRDLLWTRSEGEDRILSELRDLLDRAIDEEPSILLTEGNLIRQGFHEELDNLKEMKENSQKILREYLEEEKTGTGISSLKIRYNKIIGYFLEVTKSNLAHVPSHFIRRQSLVGNERFTTDRLIELETNLNSAREKAVDLEKSIFLEVRGRVKERVSDLLSAAEALSVLDCYASLAYVATRSGYVRPKVNAGADLYIVDGRHPVVEAHLPQGEFVPNSLNAAVPARTFSFITGPNMAGKSTYLRQNALIVLMAQIGSFVPASEARIGCVDKIFCRVGASDNLARGESTFLVEMNETAFILRTATERSLIIMDEVGRGTSTNDGLSIAWAVTEYLVKRVKAKTLFATHYHELTLLKLKSIQNLSLEVVENRGEIVFMKKIQEGPAASSYGIHVAQLAGLPEEVIREARRILDELEDREGEVKQALVQKGGFSGPDKTVEQGSLFSSGELLEKEILGLDLNRITPLEALNLVSRWQKSLTNK